MDGVGISIIGRPRPLPGHDTPNPAHNTYTLKCEEPENDPQEMARGGNRPVWTLRSWLPRSLSRWWRAGVSRARPVKHQR